jgi:hypothetical protein
LSSRRGGFTMGGRCTGRCGGTARRGARAGWRSPGPEATRASFLRGRGRVTASRRYRYSSARVASSCAASAAASRSAHRSGSLVPRGQAARRRGHPGAANDGREPRPSTGTLSHCGLARPWDGRARHHETSGPSRPPSHGVTHGDRGRPRGPEGLREGDDSDCHRHEQRRHDSCLPQPRAAWASTGSEASGGPGRCPDRVRAPGVQGTGIAADRPGGPTGTAPGPGPGQRPLGVRHPRSGHPNGLPCSQVVVPFPARPRGPVETIPERE